MSLNLFVRFEGVIAPNISQAFFSLRDNSIPDTLIPTEHHTASAIMKHQYGRFGPVSTSALTHFLDEQQIDVSFARLVEACRETGVSVTVVTNEFTYSAERILKAKRIRGVNIVGNHLMLNGDIVIPEFPHQNTDCPRCSCCARNIMLNGSSDQAAIAFVGAGSIDYCPASYADIVFARGELQTWCQQKNISYREFLTLDDVTVDLKRITQKRRIPKRREADHLRRAAFSAE